MFDTNEPETLFAVRALAQEVRDKRRPIAFWVGAGASSWCGYPSWFDLAEIFHHRFSRQIRAYDKVRGLAHLQAKDFPALFQSCRDADRHAYFRLLSEQLGERSQTPLYKRFVTAVSAITPPRIFTTNVDGQLEKSLPMADELGRNDIERAIDLLNRDRGFVCKLHGSSSDIESTVFTTDDYSSLVADHRYISHLGALLSRLTVVFVGYGLRDDYVISRLAANHDLFRLFGDGPHFAVLSNNFTALPKSVRRITYIPEANSDHRSPLQLVEEIVQLRAASTETISKKPEAPKPLSAHLLFHVFAPGTWQSSQTMTIRAESDAKEREMIVGTGFTNVELLHDRPTAMHDVLVGLLCFDVVMAPIEALAQLHDLLGAERFWLLIKEDLLRFIYWEFHEAITFPEPNAVSGGDLGSIAMMNPDKTPFTLGQTIRRSLKPAPGKEFEAEQLFERLERNVTKVSDEGVGIPQSVRSLLLRPSIRKLLGISLGTSASSLAKWHVFPVLRLASVVRMGAACRALGIVSARLDYGCAGLAGPALAAGTDRECIDDVASYVTCGRFNADLGGIALRAPEVLEAVLRFRETAAGTSLRTHIRHLLVAREGAEVVVAINGGLTSAIPTSVLQAANDQFVQLLVPTATTAFTLAIWNDTRSADDALRLWRKLNFEKLTRVCSELKVKPYDPCPCGSSEKLKFCCWEALSS